MTHAEAEAVFSVLATFGEAHPRLCEGDARLYRDLARAAWQSLLTQPSRDDEVDRMQAGEAVSAALEKLFGPCQGEVRGQGIVAAIRKAGLTIRLTDKAILVGPQEKLTTWHRHLLKHWRTDVTKALISEGLAKVV